MPQLNNEQAAAPERLDIDSAASTFADFLSDDPEYRESEPEEKKPAKPTKKQPEPKPDGDEDEVVEGEEAEAEKPESTQDEDEHPEGEEGEPDETGEETEDDEQPEPRKFKVKVDGQDIEVTEDELRNGYSRTQDYTRKTQKLAEERKAFQSEKEAVARERQEYATYLSQLKQALETSVQEPNWDTLRAENPEAFATTWAQWQQHQERIKRVEAEQQATMEKIARDHAERFNSYREEQKNQLFEKLPDWKNEEVAGKELKEIRDFATSKGFTDDEVNQVYDHRLVLLLRDAMLYNKAQQKKAEVQKKVEKVVVEKPQKKAAKQNRKMPEAVKAMLRARKTGSVKDAANFFEQIIDD